MIVVCGSGSWGTALATVVARNSKEDVLIWGRELDALEEISTQHTNHRYLPDIKLPENIVSCTDLQEALSKATDILMAVPSKAFVEVLQEMKPLLTPKHRIVWATKGLEPDQGRFLDKVLVEVLGPEQIYAVLSGPSFALEVANDLPTAVAVACTDDKFSEDLLTYFHAGNFRVYLTDDVTGVQVGGVIKNVLAVAAGISDGLGYGANARAAIVTRGIAEMIHFGKALGAKLETLQGLAGVGDVLLTCTDDQSRNRRFGLAIAKGQEKSDAKAAIGQIVEAAHNVAEVCKIASENNIDMPIAEHVSQILSDKATPEEAVLSLLSRKPASEW